MEQKRDKDNEVIQPDLFGVRKKREKSKQELLERNKADKAAGIKPVPKPLFDEDAPSPTES